MISLEQLKKEIQSDTILISVMFANNEIGTIQPIEEIGKIAKKNKIYFHTDAVQAIGNVPIDVKQMNIDLLSLSSHKFYGPKGVGAIYIKNGVNIESIQHGGHQENDKRAGTENVPGIVGLGKAIEIAQDNLYRHSEKLQEIRDYYIKQIEMKIPNVKLNGHRTKRLPGNANISFLGINGEELLLNLSLKGICASGGSACNSSSKSASHVLKAIGLSEDLAHGALRTTFGEDNTLEDIDIVVNELVKIIEKLRKK